MERIRAGGSGIAAVLSDICYAEALNQPVETINGMIGYGS